MPIKVAIFEFQDHMELIRVLKSLFNDDVVTLYTTLYFYGLFCNELDQWDIKTVVKEDNETFGDFFLRYKGQIDNNDIIFISSIGNGLKAISKEKFSPKVILNIHNLNRWIEWRNNIQTLSEFKRNYKGRNFITLKYIKNLIVECINCRYRKNILKYISCINLLHPNMGRKFADSKYGSESKIITNIPFKWYVDDYPLAKNNADYLSVAIPGTVSQKRRNYIGLLKNIKDFKFEKKRNIKIFLLGQFENPKYRKDVLSCIADIYNPQIDIIVHNDNEYIDELIFANTMKRMDVILAPINLVNTCNVCNETYGKTKATGADFDAICYKKPIIMPGNYVPIDYVSDFYDLYSDYNDLNRILNKYLDTEQLEKKYKLISNFYDQYTLKSIKKDFLDALSVQIKQYAKVATNEK